MTAEGVIPHHDCVLCGDSGWITVIDLDGESAHETACPNGCPTPSTGPSLAHEETEVPF